MKKLEFTYADIEKMTQNLQRVIGEGGNAKVYHGLTADSKQVAVKLLCEGPDMKIQFQTEANQLTRAHHRKLTNLVGYCYKGSHVALVYEYMARGNLQERLLGPILPLSIYILDYFLATILLLLNHRYCFSYHRVGSLSVDPQIAATIYPSLETPIQSIYVTILACTLLSLYVKREISLDVEMYQATLVDQSYDPLHHGW